jgi:hypothetical protein
MIWEYVFDMFITDPFVFFHQRERACVRVRRRLALLRRFARVDDKRSHLRLRQTKARDEREVLHCEVYL